MKSLNFGRWKSGNFGQKPWNFGQTSRYQYLSSYLRFSPPQLACKLFAFLSSSFTALFLQHDPRETLTRKPAHRLCGQSIPEGKAQDRKNGGRGHLSYGFRLATMVRCRTSGRDVCPLRDRVSGPVQCRLRRWAASVCPSHCQHHALGQRCLSHVRVLPLFAHPFSQAWLFCGTLASSQ